MSNQKITQKDRDHLADIVWYIKGQVNVLKLNDDYSSEFNEGHIESLEKYMNFSPEREGLIKAGIQSLENHWVLDPITTFEELANEAKSKRAVYHSNWGIKPAQVVMNMPGEVLRGLIESNGLHKLAKK